MRKKIVSDLLTVLLIINSLFAVPVNASISEEQMQSGEETELYDGETETEVTESSVSAITEGLPVLEEDAQIEESVAPKNENDTSMNNLENKGDIPIDEEHFPDKKFRKYVSGEQFDKNQDGIFSPEEIAGITSISAWISEEDKPDFSDMRGVEYFENLTWLSIVLSESLGQFDFDKMPLLEHLSINSSSMETIDLTANKHLKSLYTDKTVSELILSDDNQIESFNFIAGNLNQSCVQKMKRLRTLKVYGETAQKLDTSYCTELEFLELDMEFLPELELRNNKKLKTLEITGGSAQEKLDLSENRELETLKIRCWKYMENYGFISTENCYNSVGFIDQVGKLERKQDGSYDLNSLHGYNPKLFRAVYGAEVIEGMLYPKEQYVTYEYYLDSRKDKFGTFVFDCGTQINPEAVEGLTITGKTETSISCKWAASKDKHTGYVIYAKNVATGKNEKRIILKKGTTLYTIHGLKPGGRYEIIVRAYRTYAGKNYYSVYYKGTEFSYTMPVKPILKVSTSGTKVKYTWSHKKADYRKADSGYLLYHSTNKKGPYTRAVILSDTKKSYSMNLKKGCTYYFKMRAYVQYNKWTSPTFSKFSNVVSKKI